MLYLKQIGKFKYFEFQFNKEDYRPWLNFLFSFRVHGGLDHPGIYFDLSIGKFYLGVELYDSREEEWYMDQNEN
jgi:hypothetical protein